MNEKHRIFELALLSVLFSMACAWSSIIPSQAQPTSPPGAILYLDHFSNPSSGWDTWQDEGSSVAYQDGSLRFGIHQPNLDIWSRPGLKYGDVILEVDAARLTGPDDNDFGLICRFVDQENFYAFLISSDGYAGIVRVLDGVYKVISSTNMEYNALIQGGNAANRIGAGCIQSNLTLYINNEKALTAQDFSHPYGEVGLMAGAVSQTGVEIVFDNFIVKNP
jgi:hypothetical protein